jgi:hypothetical protein
LSPLLHLWTQCPLKERVKVERVKVERVKVERVKVERSEAGPLPPAVLTMCRRPRCCCL